MKKKLIKVVGKDRKREKKRKKIWRREGVNRRGRLRLIQRVKEGRENV